MYRVVRGVLVLLCAAVSGGCATQHLVRVGYRKQTLETPTDVYKAPDGALAIKAGAVWRDARGLFLGRHPAKFIVGDAKAVNGYLALRFGATTGSVVDVRFSNLFWKWSVSGLSVNRAWAAVPHRDPPRDASTDVLPGKFLGPGSVHSPSNSVPYDFKGRTCELVFKPCDIYGGYAPWAVPLQIVGAFPALALDLVTSPLQIVFYAAAGTRAADNPWRNLRHPVLSAQLIDF